MEKWLLESLVVMSLVILLSGTSASVPKSSASYSFYRYKEEKRFFIKFKFIHLYIKKIHSI